MLNLNKNFNNINNYNKSLKLILNNIFTLKNQYKFQNIQFYTTTINNSNNTNNKFKLNNDFVNKYRNKESPFGFGILGELVYIRTYSRIKEDGKTNEKWFETVERVVNGTYNMQKQWIESNGFTWNGDKAQKSAQQMYDRIYTMKFLPPGRGLWSMGSSITEERGLFAALNNCAFVSTEKLNENPSKPFLFLMDATMLGVGVGFDTKGENSFIVPGYKEDGQYTFTVPDSREGWVESVKLLLDSYFLNQSKPKFDYTQIRQRGEPIKGFGGVCSGSEPLEELHKHLECQLDRSVGSLVSCRLIVDIMNLIGKCVVSGNIRQAAEISFGSPDSEEFINLKNYEINQYRKSFGWISNNSIFATIGMGYGPIVKRIIDNGEPGIAWLDNMKAYSRMMETEKDYKDINASGANPCLEQTLHSYEICCLVETFPNNHGSLEEYLETLKYAFLYAKTVTLGKTHWDDTNKVLLQNRRIGCSMSGIAQFITKHGISELKRWCNKGYDYVNTIDEKYSNWLNIPKSIKKTSIKPSGTVSLLAGATPGLHYPISEFYIRRVRIPKTGNEHLLSLLSQSGYHIEEAIDNKYNMVVEIPIHAGDGIRSSSTISMWEQLELASFLQKNWSDNQVSCTVSFDPLIEGPQLSSALDYYQYHLKGISFLPNSQLNSSESTIYKQMPYESISKDLYLKLISNLKPVNFDTLQNTIQSIPDKYCDSSNCLILK